MGKRLTNEEFQQRLASEHPNVHTNDIYEKAILF